MGSTQHRLQHLNRCRLAVGARDAQPGSQVRWVAQPPSQLHVTPYQQPAPRSLCRQRRAGRYAGRHHHQVEVTGKVAARVAPEADVDTEDLQQGGLLARSLVGGLGDDRHGGTEVLEGVGGRESREPEACDRDPDLLPG
jgi:hypothetical protein